MSRVFIVMKDGNDIIGEKVFNEGNCRTHYSKLTNKLQLTTSKGKSCVIPGDNMLFYGEIFAGVEIPILNNIQEVMLQTDFKSDTEPLPSPVQTPVQNDAKIENKQPVEEKRNGFNSK